VAARLPEELSTTSPRSPTTCAVFLLGRLFLSVQHFLTGDGTMAETFQNMGVLLLTLNPRGLDAAVLRGVQRPHDGAAAGASAQALQNRAGQILGRGHHACLLMTVGTLIDLVPLYLFGNPETTTILSGSWVVLLGMAAWRWPVLLALTQPDSSRR